MKVDYAYQPAGIDFLARHKTGLLADQPGLGKTYQAIAAADKIGATKIIVVCTASMVRTIENEFLKWQTIPRKIKVIKKGTDTPIYDGVNIVSYDLARTKKLHQALMKKRWALLILDECDALKNPSAKRTQKMLGMRNEPGLAQRADRVWGLSGTPVRNNAAEIWPLLNAIYPEGITVDGKKLTYWGFAYRYCQVIDTHFGKKIIGHSNYIRELRNKLDGNFMLRRMKKDCLPDLPPIRYGHIYVDPASGDARTLAELENFITEYNDEAGSIEDLLVNGTFHRIDGPLMTIRRLTERLKVPGVIDIVKSDLHSGIEKIIIFAIHLDTIEGLLAGLSEFECVHITGSVTQKNRQAAIEAFHEGSAKVFIGQLVAASQGLTLHAHGKCSDVIFTSLDFVPATNSQAAMRVHRIGQPNSVLVRVATLAGSIDEKVSEILLHKIEMLTDLIELDDANAA